MKDTDITGSVFTRTNVPNLYRYKNGRYYSRLTIDGKRQFRCLGTNLKETAKFELLKQERQAGIQSKASLSPVGRGPQPITCRDCLNLARQKLELSTDLAAGTRSFYLLGLMDVEKLWHRLDEKPRNVTPIDVLIFLKRRLAKRFTPMNAKNAVFAKRAEASNTTYNRALAGIRRVLKVAKAYSLVELNVAYDDDVKVRTQSKKKVHLCSRADFQRMRELLAKSPQPKHREANYLIRAMASTGARLTSASEIRWEDVKDKGIHFRCAKGGSSYDIPWMEDSRNLFKEIREFRGSVEPEERVFKIKECQKSINTACKELGIPRMTHHDFRHLFATHCIESGVDIPTVSVWMNHHDGGKLLMETYAHLLDEHSRRMAEKVNSRITP